MCPSGTQALFLPTGLGYKDTDFSIFSIVSLPFTCPLKAECRMMSVAVAARVRVCGGGASAEPARGWH